jgi:chitodextrinase
MRATAQWRHALAAWAVLAVSIGCSGGGKTAAPPADTTPPTAPASLTAAAASQSQIDLSWSPSTDNVGVAGYWAYRDGIPFQVVAVPAASDVGLDPETRHCYRVTARDAAGNESAFSPEACATTLPPDVTPPTAPPDLVTTAVSASGIDLSWSAATDDVGVVGYQVQRDGVTVASAAGRTYSDLGLRASVQYCYTVTALDAAGNEGPPSPSSCAETPPHLVWARQLGTSTEDEARGVAVDAAGNVLVAGFTRGVLDPSAVGSMDAVLVKYDAGGNLLWTRQLGSTDDDWAVAVAVDPGGNAYVAGTTQGAVGGPNAGGSDVFLAKFDPSGILTWARQLGSAADDGAEGVAVDASGNAYVVGLTKGSLDGSYQGLGDGFVAKYGPDGIWLWTHQLGTSGDDAIYGVAVDAAGNPFVTGETTGVLAGTSNAGNWDFFLARYDPIGPATTVWVRQAGTLVNDSGYGVAVDPGGNVVALGTTGSRMFGLPSFGRDDAFLVRYDASGNRLWAAEWGSTGNEIGVGVAVDGAGNVYAAGYTDASLDGNPSAGGFDVFLTRFDADGPKAWTVQVGTATTDFAHAVAVDRTTGEVVVVGATSGGLLGNTSAGNTDIFVVKYRP